MNRRIERPFWLTVALALCSAAAVAQPNPPLPRNEPGGPPPQNAQPGPPQTPAERFGLPTVALAPLLDRVARESHKQFLVDSRVPPQIYLGTARPEDVNYPLLLSILRINFLASVEIEGRVNIVPAGTVRTYAVPIVQSDDKSIAADEFVTRIITVANTNAGGLVPVLRPLLPVEAHLAALAPNQLIMMDRYANVQRITALVKALDKAAPQER